jgi:hypothetical protein
MNTEKPTYNPQSYFFVDHTALATATENNKALDAYGPVFGCEEEEYRTTSFVRTSNSNTPVQVYAICEGQILIQPMTGSDDKVNIILKPSASYAPLKIKYFVYRGLRKADLIDSGLLPSINENDTNQPTLLKKIWRNFKRFNKVDDTAELLASLIGYDPEISETTLIDEFFLNQETNNYQLPHCKAGEWLGNCTDRIGLDIVLDDGDYRLEHQQELFVFNLEYARKQEQIFSIVDIVNTDTAIQDVYRKRYKEYILRFMDAAAFWGSHIECGTITLCDNSNIKTADEIYTTILNTYQTKHCVYIHITEERGRSFAYYDDPDTKRKVSFDVSLNLENYETSGWPIFLFKRDTITASDIFNGVLECGVAATSFKALNVITPISIENNHFPKTYQEPQNNIVSFVFMCEYLSDNDTLCASFMFIHCNLEQELSFNEYYNNLWQVNIKHPFNISDTINKTAGCTYDRNLLINIGAGAVIQNKVVFDTGVNQSLNPTTKKRRLFIAGIKANTDIDATLNVENFTSHLDNSSSYDTYMQYLYGNMHTLIKDTFIDGSDTIHSLCLKNSKSFFQLGITEEEYNALMFNNSEILPASVHVPTDADNMFFYLSKESDLQNGIRKYQLGIRYEDNTGQLSTPLFPTNPIYVYTLDGFYFFSKEYSAYQHLFYTRHSALFYPTNSYNGEFGFDWMREGETLIPGDEAYRKIMGKLKQYNKETKEYDKIVTDVNTYEEALPKIKFMPDEEMFNELEKEYDYFSVEINHQEEKYYKPMLAIYPNTPLPSLDNQPIFNLQSQEEIEADFKVNREADLTLKVAIAYGYEPEQIHLVYDETVFDITLKNGQTVVNKDNIPTACGIYNYTVTILCNTEFAEEKEITVIADFPDNPSKELGAIRIKPNAQSLRKSKKILIVPIKTDIDKDNNQENAKEPSKERVATIALRLKKFLRQVFISPIFEKLSIDTTGNSTPFKQKFNSSYVKYEKQLSGEAKYAVIGYDNADSDLEDIDVFLGNYIKSTKGTKYDDYSKIFLFEESGIFRETEKGGFEEGLSGFSNPYRKNQVVVFTSSRRDASIHEILHSLGVSHSFTAESRLNPNAKYTYQSLKTDNLMDYSHNAEPPIDGISLWNWQSEIVHTKNNLDAE